jgi:hypothetical protein
MRRPGLARGPTATEGVRILLAGAALGARQGGSQGQDDEHRQHGCDTQDYHGGKDNNPGPRRPTPLWPGRSG